MNTQVLLALAPYLVPVLIAILTPIVTYAVNRLLSRLPVTQRTIVTSIVRSGVAATEQMADSSLNGPGKKQFALELIEKQLAAHHIQVSASELNSLIEETVFALNSAKQATTVASVPLPMHTDTKGV